MAEFHKTARVKMRLGEQLVAAGLISSDALQDALRHAREEGLRLGEYLVGAGIVTEAEVLRAVASQLHVPVYNKDTFPIEEKLASVIPADFARRHRVVPLCMRRGVLYAGLLDAHDFQTLDEIEELTHCQMEPVLCLRADFVRLFTAVYGEYSAVGEMLDNLGDSPRAQSGVQGGVQDQEIEGDASEVPVIKLVNLIISEALKKGASDIHINPEKNEIKVRYRVEGLLRRASTIPVSMGSAVASRVKIMGNMDISETRLPQDGRFTVKAEGREVNVRVSTLPTTYGENIVLRLLDMASGIIYDLPKLGMNQADYASLTRCARKPYGMILSTGPTGHLVLSTLHTNDALSAVYRLVDMGVPAYLVTSVLLCTFAQRLVRTVCPHCREEYMPNEAMLRDLGLRPEDGPFYHGAGCPQCGGTGYSGRTAIFEVLPMTDDFSRMVTKGESMQAVYRRALEEGLHTMRQDAAQKIRAGVTTCEEALRVTMA